jgi:YHS domain-containing protein
MSALCPTCGCSLVRLGIERGDAAHRRHQGKEVLFCCEPCAELFDEAPERYLAEIEDWIVCPTCLAEKPKHLTIAFTHERGEVRLCRCPCCVKEFCKRPDELLARLDG